MVDGRNIADRIMVAWNWFNIRNAPSRGDSAGCDPQTRAMLLTIGKMMPPVRAVLAGTAGAITASEATSA